MKRFLYKAFSLFISAALALGAVCPAVIRAETGIFVPSTGKAPETPAPRVLPTQNPQDDPFSDISTPHILLTEAESGIALYNRAGQEKAFPASTTKIMTALLAIEKLPDLNEVITIDWHYLLGFGPTSSMMDLVSGEKIALIDILRGLMMRSGNDAARTLAAETAFRLYGRDKDVSENTAVDNAVEKFVGLMNEKAAELGMLSTHFATVDGRHDDEHYTTAYDFTLLMRYALKNPTLKKLMSAPTYDIKPNNKHKNGYHLENSNKLICKRANDKRDVRYKYCIAGKTGQTNQAGYCLVTAAEKNGVKLILVQFGDDNEALSGYYRYEAATKIYEWGFKNFAEYPLDKFGVKKEFELQAAGYSPYDEHYGKFIAKADIKGVTVKGAAEYLRRTMNDASGVRTELEFLNLTAPIKKGDIVGKVKYYFYENFSTEAPLLAQRDIAAASQETPEPHETNFITGTRPPSRDKTCNLSLLRITGGDEYSVWVYYENSLYTMDSTEWHYLYCDGTVFRAAASAEHAGKISLYKRLFDSSDIPYYKLTDGAVSGGAYLIVSDGMALCAERNSGTLGAVRVNTDENGIIARGVKEQMIWNFEVKSNGYYITNASKYLSRSAGSGALLWITVIVLLLTAAVCIHLITNEKSRRKRRLRRHSRKSRYYMKRPG